ncbi:MarR family winged helix-turn-helix transcriptional regulator [Marinomonas mediterranea]|nr:MarR family transcriptional regulator [Marinomonas mediterranea]
MTREFSKGEQTLTPMQARALMYVARFEGIRQRELADRLDIQPIALVRLIDLLTSENLVERRADPSDRRAYRLYLKEDAAPTLEVLKDDVEAINSRALAALNDEEVEQLMYLIEKVHTSFSTPSDQ